MRELPMPLRVLGKKAGVIVLLGDVAKTVLAVVLVKVIFARTHGDMLPLLGMYAAAGAILGHNFPVQLGFRGGKGIACTAGLVLTLGPIVTIAGGSYLPFDSRTDQICISGIHFGSY